MSGLHWNKLKFRYIIEKPNCSKFMAQKKYEIENTKNYSLMKMNSKFKARRIFTMKSDSLSLLNIS